MHGMQFFQLEAGGGEIGSKLLVGMSHGTSVGD